MSKYHENKARAVTFNNEPTLTDQAGHKETDINIIVGQYLTTGQAPGSRKQPMHGNFAKLPTDLRGMVETSRSIERPRTNLPAQLAKKPVEELLALTPEALTRILTPEPPPKADKEAT